MAEQIECVVVGAGVVGLAIARAMAERGKETLVLEHERVIGSGISSRNSEVIHAGIYYPKNSLRARLCVRGRQLLYAYCRERGIEHRGCGKLIVAVSDEQIATLETLQAAGAANGVTDLEWMSAGEVQSIEPNLQCVRALHSPSTGIVDSHGLMLGLRGDLEHAGGIVAVAAAVTGGECSDEGIVLQVDGDEPIQLTTRVLINAAGLGAQALALSLANLPRNTIPPLYFAKGNYFTLSGRSPCTRLVYPVPEPGGLGVHLTIDLAGQARFGPDVEWIKAPDYSVNSQRMGQFYAAIRRYWPGLADGALQPGYAGVRPKLSAPGEPAADFVIQGSEVHGIPGLVNLYGIESPGLTSALAIAEYVSSLI